MKKRMKQHYSFPELGDGDDTKSNDDSRLRDGEWVAECCIPDM